MSDTQIALLLTLLVVLFAPGDLWLAFIVPAAWGARAWWVDR